MENEKPKEITFKPEHKLYLMCSHLPTKEPTEGDRLFWKRIHTIAFTASFTAEKIKALVGQEPLTTERAGKGRKG